MTERRAKYNARPTEIDGQRFDSQAEARRYEELRLLQRAGVIHDLVIHPRFELQPAFETDGKRHRAIYYEGDFQYREDGRLVVEDVKGVETVLFKLKVKLFLYKYPKVELRITDAYSKKRTMRAR